jgi:predicted nucleic-acid-binding Zn-ribbon protein
MKDRACPNCKGTNQYRAEKPVSARGTYGPNFLPRLGTLFASAQFRMIVCGDCGLTRFFADDAARVEVAESRHWARV